MYFLNDITELTESKMQKIILDWMCHDKARMEKYKSYYEGNHPILERVYTDPNVPNNKVVSNFAFDMVSQYSGFLSGVPIQYVSQEDISDIINILEYNDVHSEDVNFLENALKYGQAFELFYLDAEANQRFKVIDSLEMIPIYYNDLDAELMAVIRLYSANDVDKQLDTFVDVYTETEIIHYKSNTGFQNFSFISKTPHHYGMCPCTVFYLNNDHTSIFDRVVTLQDAYNNLLSDEVNDMEAFTDALLALQGLEGTDSEDIQQMKKDRVLLLPEDANAFWITKDASKQATNELLDRIERLIERIGACPDLTDESFGTNSGIAIQYRLLSMENNASKIEAQMKKALLRRLELICQIQQILSTEFAWRDINIIFTRNIPQNLLEIAQIINQFRGLVSDKTLLGQIPFVTDVDEEQEQLTLERKAQNDAYSDFIYTEDLNEN